MTTTAAVAASGPSWTDIATAIGTVFAGLALPLAFIQLMGLRQDRLRAQVSKVGAWTGTPELMDGDVLVWKIFVFVRNASELPVAVAAVDVSAQPWGYVRVHAPLDDGDEFKPSFEKKVSKSEETSLAPGTIAPGDTWSGDWRYRPSPKLTYAYQQPLAPMTSVVGLVVTDAAGYQWEVRAAKPGPARRVGQGRVWRWKRHGDL